jgi:hypothetical protein
MKQQREPRMNFSGKFGATLVFGTVLVLLAQVAEAQQSIGRTQSSGTWTDSHWSDENGPTGAPGASDYAYIGYLDVSRGWAGNSAVSLDTNAEVSTVILGDGTNFGTLTIDAGSNLKAGSIQLYSGSTLNINGGLEVTSIIFANGGTINQNGAFFVDNLYLGWVGEATVFNRTGGDLYANYVRVLSGSSLSIRNGDTVTSMEVDSSTLTLESQLSMSDLSLYNSTLVLNDNLDLTFQLVLDHSTLVRNNNATFSTSNLRLYGVDYDMDGTDIVSDTITVDSGGTLTISNPTYFPGSVQASGSTINVNSNLGTSIMIMNDSTLNLNADLDATSLYANGGTINQNGNIAGSMSLGWGGTETIFNRNSGTLTLQGLDLTDSVLELDGADSVQTAGLYSGSTLTINDAMQMGGITVGESTLILNDSLALDSYVSLYNATVIRNNGAGFATTDLYVSTMDYQLDGTDSVSNLLDIDNGTLDVAVATTLATLAADQAIVKIDANLVASTFSMNNSNVNLNRELESVNMYINGGQFIQNANISSSSMQVGAFGDTTSYQRMSGNLTVDHLYLSSASQLTLNGNDSISEVSIAANSLLSYQQLNGQMTGLDLQGLTIESGSNLNLLFDGASGDGLDWGLRLAGDQQIYLNELLSDGRLTSNWMDAEVVYNAGAYGDYTYFGSFTAVPEPSSGALLAVASLAVTVLHRRQRRS